MNDAFHPELPAPADTGQTPTQRVYDSIHAAILELRLPPGTRLREEALAEQFSVSRTLVRQALHRLAQDQVIELRHNRGAVVPSPTYEEARQVFDVRRLLECDVARRIAGQLSDEQLEQLHALVRQEEQALARNDRPNSIRLSGEFHRALARMSGNPLLLRLLDGLLPTTSMLMALYQASQKPVCVAHRHVELIQALRGSPGSAATEMRRHLQELERSLVQPASAPAPRRDLFAGYREPAAADPRG
ncbi:GntR family transcriptional regulator [Sphaerotilus hippei]|uniref:GntR family transcriptional regulator n=1 Tax=Sphaerotilus hippei TaxID=744406 RepID=A0A318H688_9BURK|nr:GntR family transcriptional regulator [Sphaerotilus hippei]PXW99497.1 GntR family transcriptional regulator [Sphaerotilus hippei]